MKKLSFIGNESVTIISFTFGVLAVYMLANITQNGCKMTVSTIALQLVMAIAFIWIAVAMTNYFDCHRALEMQLFGERITVVHVVLGTIAVLYDNIKSHFASHTVIRKTVKENARGLLEENLCICCGTSINNGNLCRDCKKGKYPSKAFAEPKDFSVHDFMSRYTFKSVLSCMEAVEENAV